MNTASLMHASKPAWYILRTMPQHEKKVAVYLCKKRIEHYLPLVKRKRQWSDRIKVIDFPLFPGYLFVKINFALEGFGILQHRGTLTYVKQNDQPIAVQADMIDEIKQIIKAGHEIQADPIANFPPGEKVVVQIGPFKGQEAVVLRVKNKQRICIKLESMEHFITVEAEYLEKLLSD